MLAFFQKIPYNNLCSVEDIQTYIGLVAQLDRATAF